MRYFTRQLFEAVQSGPGSPDADNAIRVWEKSVMEYRAALEFIRPRLKNGFEWFADNTLHDGVITHVDASHSGQIVLVIDAENNPWGQTGTVALRFNGIRSADGTADCLGDVWLYEELHVVGDTAELRVLLEGGEIRIAAESLVVTCGPDGIDE